MTPDTAALRALHTPAPGNEWCPTCREDDPCDVRALCDAADEVERLRSANEQALQHVDAINEERRKERTAHAALVAELRGLPVECPAPASGEWSPAYLDGYEAGVLAARALLDRHAPEETT